MDTKFLLKILSPNSEKKDVKKLVSLIKKQDQEWDDLLKSLIKKQVVKRKKKKL